MKNFLLGTLLTCIVGLPTLGHADEVEQMVLMLPNEEAECRYIATLANNARKALRGSEALRDEGEQLASAGAYEQAARKMIAANISANTTTLNEMLKVTSATGTVRIKRGTLPPCAVPLYEEGQAGVAAAIHLASDCAARGGTLTQKVTGRY